MASHRHIACKMPKAEEKASIKNPVTKKKSSSTVEMPKTVKNVPIKNPVTKKKTSSTVELYEMQMPAKTFKSKIPVLTGDLVRYMKIYQYTMYKLLCKHVCF